MVVSRRVIFTLLSLLSLVVCVSAAGMWLRRTQLSDHLEWISSSEPTAKRPGVCSSWNFSFSGGVIAFERRREKVDQAEQPFWTMQRYNRFRHEVAPPS